MKTQFLDINGLRHHFYCWGDPKRPKLFLFHGYLDSGVTFAFLCEQLQSKFHCMAPDLRGFGDTAWTPNPHGYSWFEYLADAHAIFQTLSAEEPVRALGHSMGGNILAFYAGTFPERVSHFINLEGFGIEDMPPEEGPLRMRKWVEHRAALPFAKYKGAGDFAQRLERRNPKLSGSRAEFLSRHLLRGEEDGFRFKADPRHAWVNPQLFQVQNAGAFWKRIQAKCLLVRGADTNWEELLQHEGELNFNLEERLRRFPPTAEKAVISGSGHWPHHDQPEDLAHRIEEFLSM